MTKFQSQLDRMLKSNGKISNTQGIKMAYDRDNKIVVKDNKMYIGGTTSGWKILLKYPLVFWVECVIWNAT